MAINLDTLTPEAHHVLGFAQEEAKKMYHNYLGTEHLLLGLLRAKEQPPAKVLNDMGVQLPRARSAVEFIIGRGEVTDDLQPSSNMTPRLEKAIGLAKLEAQQLDQSDVEPVHLLLGLLSEGEGIACGILESLSVRLDKARQRTLLLFDQSAPAAEE